MKIAVIGCGWLGLPLSQKLIEMGHLVYGSTTRSEKIVDLNKAEIIPFLYDGIHQVELPEWSHEIECVVLNFPPSKSANYPVQIENLLKQFPPSCAIIFTSSTSVYVETEGEVDENGLVKTEHAVALAEKEVLNSKNPATILRLGGLIGENRHPIRYLSGKNVENGNHVVNLVHRDDVIASILSILENAAWNKTYNICWNHHPSKSDYYATKAKELNLTQPIFSFSVGKGKIVKGENIVNELGFSYTHPI